MSNQTTGQPVFYSLPANAMLAGMSTADGQDVLSVTIADGMVFAPVYTPSEDPDEDNDRQCAPDSRMYEHDEMVDLAVFPDTDVDGTAHPLAVIRHLPTDSRLDYCQCGVSWPCPQAEPAPVSPLTMFLLTRIGASFTGPVQDVALDITLTVDDAVPGRMEVAYTYPQDGEVRTGTLVLEGEDAAEAQRLVLASQANNA